MSGQKIVWITGASSGIGRSIAVEFVKNGCTVAGTSRHLESLERLKSSLDGENGRFIPVPLDVSDHEKMKNSISKLIEENRLECLINNAGVTSFSKAVDDTAAKIQKIIDINLLGSIFAIKTVLPQMIENKKGFIFNILSIASQKIFTESSAYSASKSGLRAYANVLREEVREHNIRVMNLLPGATRTPIWPNSELEKYAERMMSPDDIAKLIWGFFSAPNSVVPEELVLRPVLGDI